MESGRDVVKTPSRHHVVKVAMVIDAKRSVEREMLSVDRRKALVVELPLDVDLTLGKIGDGLERRNRQV